MGSPAIFNGANTKLLTKGVIVNGDGTTYARGLSVVYQTGSATAAAYTCYQCNTTSAAFTMTLPNGASGYVIRFVDDAGTWATNNLTIAPAGGQTIQGISGNGSLVCNLSGAYVELSWDATNSYWVVQASGFQYGPLADTSGNAGIVNPYGGTGVVYSGTWAPTPTVISGFTTPGNVAASTGSYVRVGSVVTCSFQLATGAGNMNGSAISLTVPFPIARASGAGIVAGTGIGGVSVALGAPLRVTENNATSCSIQNAGGTSSGGGTTYAIVFTYTLS